MHKRIVLRALMLVALAALIAVPAASAHVTLNPREWEAGGFARFSVRVPNERPDAATTEVTVQFPDNVISASFQPVPGWERTVTMVTLDTPIEGEDGEITEKIDSVTWSGGRIEPGEFQEFGVSFQVPEDAAGSSLVFPSHPDLRGRRGRPLDRRRGRPTRPPRRSRCSRPRRRAAARRRRRRPPTEDEGGRARLPRQPTTGRTTARQATLAVVLASSRSS